MRDRIAQRTTAGNRFTFRPLLGQRIGGMAKPFEFELAVRRKWRNGSSGQHAANSELRDQGFRQWGVYDGTMRGGYGGGEFDDVYEEVGGCVNSMYPGGGKQGMAGLVKTAAATRFMAESSHRPTAAICVERKPGNAIQLLLRGARFEPGSVEVFDDRVRASGRYESLGQHSGLMAASARYGYGDV